MKDDEPATHGRCRAHRELHGGGGLQPSLGGVARRHRGKGLRLILPRRRTGRGHEDPRRHHCGAHHHGGPDGPSLIWRGHAVGFPKSAAFPLHQGVVGAMDGEVDRLSYGPQVEVSISGSGYLSGMPTAPADWLRHLEDEADAAFLYRELAAGGARCRSSRSLPKIGGGRRPARRALAQAPGRARARSTGARPQPFRTASSLAGPPAGWVGAASGSPRGRGPGGKGLPPALRLVPRRQGWSHRTPVGEGIQGACPDAGGDERPARASRGTAPAPAGSSGTSSTDSTTASPPTSASWPG